MIEPRAGLRCFHNGKPVLLLEFVRRLKAYDLWIARPIFVTGSDFLIEIRKGDRLTLLHSKSE